jgi:hypothetical protein
MNGVQMIRKTAPNMSDKSEREMKAGGYPRQHE